MGFLIHKIWQILKRFARIFRRAQTLKLGGVIELLFIKYVQTECMDMKKYMYQIMTCCIYANKILVKIDIYVLTFIVCSWASIFRPYLNSPKIKMYAITYNKPENAYIILLLK